MKDALRRALKDSKELDSLCNNIAGIVTSNLQGSIDGINTIVESLQSRVQDARQEVDQMNSDLAALRQQVLPCVDLLQGKVSNLAAQTSAYEDELEQMKRMNNLCIFGVQEDKKEDVRKIVENLARDIGVQLENNDIERCYRVGKGLNG